jgi:hypothetical protein
MEIYHKNKYDTNWQEFQLDFSGNLKMVGTFLIIPTTRERLVVCSNINCIVKFDGKEYDLMDSRVVEVLAKNLETVFILANLQ